MKASAEGRHMPKDQDRLIFSKPKRGKEAPERETYYLKEPLDFDEYMNLETYSEDHTEEFHLRLIQEFIDQVYAGKTPREWILMELADQFNKVLNGGRWEDEFHRKYGVKPWQIALLSAFGE